ncbi:putative DNA-binding protein [Carnobacteriaceae bacterium zg-ZUI252]|nr:putative DNA-binding protein [Carnobacteriaceae bacterium zg-ZUI252]MBS4769966.1 putative DNA-binding protein [Carnobacteriaceae bacterium zg-ZUI240]QTU83605.1 putative DNA-binding protein [Carnobacteriaceae bacterium zg-C25]
MEIEKSAQMVLLYDFYGDILTPKQKDYWELYYEQDLSLGEIAEELGVSRQAVNDNIKRTEQLLLHYEEQLEMLKQFRYQQHAIEKLLDYQQAHYPNDSTLQHLINELQQGDN